MALDLEMNTQAQQQAFLLLFLYKWPGYPVSSFHNSFYIRKKLTFSLPVPYFSPSLSS